MPGMLKDQKQLIYNHQNLKHNIINVVKAPYWGFFLCSFDNYRLIPVSIVI
jgi:hypothetical protein